MNRNSEVKNNKDLPGILLVCKDYFVGMYLDKGMIYVANIDYNYQLVFIFLENFNKHMNYWFEADFVELFFAHLVDYFFFSLQYIRDMVKVLYLKVFMFHLYLNYFN
jgi:hypothetical protein